MAEMRLQRYLAQAGIASRRKAEELILAGKVKVNGKVICEMGYKVDSLRDRVDFENQRLTLEDHVWILLNKPKGTVSTVKDPEDRQTVLDLVGNQGVRLYPVGRLDYNTEGVLLLTNDGALAHALMHPSNKIERVYHVKVQGTIALQSLEALREGLTLDTGEKVSAHNAHLLGRTEKNTWIEITLREGRNRQIHRMLDSLGYSVLKLIRVSYAGITAKGLPLGHYRSLSQKEILEIRALVALPGETSRHIPQKPGRRMRMPAPKSKPLRQKSSRRKTQAAPPSASRTGAKQTKTQRRKPLKSSKSKK